MTNSEAMQGKNDRERWKANEKNGRVWTGVFFIIVGGVALARSFMVPIPEWVFSWQTLLITIGIFIGIRENFHGAAWFILILIGGAFLLNDFYFGGELRRHVWPVVIIALGAIFILRPRNRRFGRNSKQRIWMDEDVSTVNGREDFTDLTIVFGSSKKTIESKKFAGGDITSVFGGAELDLTNADIEGKATIDVTAIFGGVELIIPSNWTIKSEVVSIFGSVQDNRIQSAALTQNPEKVIILDGTALFGGIEIRSFKK